MHMDIVLDSPQRAEGRPTLNSFTVFNSFTAKNAIVGFSAWTLLSQAILQREHQPRENSGEVRGIVGNLVYGFFTSSSRRKIQDKQSRC